jgi:hypothetical protein
LASDALLFYVFAAVTVIGSLVVVSQRNPVYSLLSLVGAFFGLCGLYVLARSASSSRWCRSSSMPARSWCCSCSS